MQRQSRQAGFTLVELLVVIAIVGILAATATPLYRTIQQRTYGREAVIMAKQLLDAQVIYFLEKNAFYPPDGGSIEIYHDHSPSKPEIQEVKDALNVTIPVGHHLDFTLYSSNQANNEGFYVTIRSSGGFPLFKGGAPEFVASVDRTGEYTYLLPD